jgi:hypothetical protein
MTVLANLFKNVYEPEFTKAFNEEYVGWQLATKLPRQFRGGAEIFGVQIGRAGGVGMRGETQGLPTPKGPTPLQASVPLRRIFGTFELSHDAIERSKGDEAAFKEAISFEIEPKFDRMLKVGNIYLYGDGRGVLATFTASGSLAAAVGSTVALTVDNARFLEAGDIVALWDTAAAQTPTANGGYGNGTTDNEQVQIQNVDYATNTVTLVRTAAGAGAATITTAATVIRNYGDSTSDFSSVRTDGQFTGLRAFADDGTLAPVMEGISRTSNPRWKGQIVDATGGVAGNTQNLTRDFLYRLNDKIRRFSGAFADTMIWDISQRREYLNIVQPDVRFAPVKEGDAGYDQEALYLSLGFKRVKCVEDSDTTFGLVFMFPKDHFFWMELSALQIDDTPGSVLRQALPYGNAGTGDVFYGYLRAKGNFATDRASAFGVLTGLNFSTE